MMRWEDFERKWPGVTSVLGKYEITGEYRYQKELVRCASIKCAVYTEH